MSKQRSLKHEYELYLEHEIETYKDSVPRSVLLALGDEAVAALGAEAQTTLTEMVLWEEVDQLIARRLKLPTYATWRRRRLRRLAELRRPEHWGLAPDGALTRALRAAAGEHVLFADGGAGVEDATLFSAALGCSVTALTLEPTVLDRMFAAADAAGVGSQVRGCVCPLGAWAPDVPLRAVVCAPDAFDALEREARIVAVSELQRATPVGGVHLLRGRAHAPATVTFEEWQTWYDGWAVSAEAPNAGANALPPATYVAQRVAELG
jgi:hypothetical protein